MDLMNPHVVFLQPRNPGNQSWPNETTTADAGQPTPAPTPTPTELTGGGTADGTGVQGGGYLSQSRCEQANQHGLIAAGGYAFGAALLGVTIFLVMRKKLWGTAFSRYLTAVLAAATLAVTLVGWDPIRADILTQCLDPNLGFTQYIFLGSMVAARALVLGLIPAVLLTVTGCFVANRT